MMMWGPDSTCGIESGGGAGGGLGVQRLCRTKFIKGYLVMLGGYEKKWWEPNMVSNQFSIWIPQGIIVSDALYETRP